MKNFLFNTGINFGLSLLLFLIGFFIPSFIIMGAAILTFIFILIADFAIYIYNK